MRQFAAAAVLLALSATRPAAARDAAFRGARRRVLLQAAASPPSGEFHANTFIFGGGIDVQSSCAVFTDLDDGGSDTLRTAVGDPRCTRIALAAGLTVALTRPLVITRSLRLECDYGAAVVASLVPPFPLSAAWDTLGGGAPRRDAIGCGGQRNARRCAAGRMHAGRWRCVAAHHGASRRSFRPARQHHQYRAAQWLCRWRRPAGWWRKHLHRCTGFAAGA